MSGTLSLKQWQKFARSSAVRKGAVKTSQATCFHENRLQDEHATSILEVATRSDPSGLQYTPENLESLKNLL